MGEDKNQKLNGVSVDDLLGELKYVDEDKIVEPGEKHLSAKSKKEALEIIKEILENTKANIQRALDLLASETIDSDKFITSLKNVKEASVNRIASSVDETERVVEGVFNGESMVSAEGKQYNVPANYASKSKLVEGDILKLTITKDGSFIYKQIGPIEREKLIATLAQDEVMGDWYAVAADNQKWRLLTASVTYYQGRPGDEVVILVPKESKSQWAAVENIIRK